MSFFSLFRDSRLDRPPVWTDHFSLRNNRKLTLSTFQVSSVTGKIDHYYFASQQVSLCYRPHTARYFASWLSSTSGSLREASSSRGVLPVDIAGCREVFSVHEVQVLLGLITCEGCLVVRSGHGPQAEVAQGFGPGPLVEL